MGQLTGEYITTGRALAEGDYEPETLHPASVFVRITRHMKMSAEDYATTETRLRELVGLRNELVHHLIERFDLQSLDGCDAALKFLDESYARVDEELLHLQGWAESSNRARLELAAIVSSDDFHLVLAESLSSGRELPLQGSKVLQLLKLAAVEHATDGWANLAAVAAALAEVASDETPERYGCSS